VASDRTGGTLASQSSWGSVSVVASAGTITDAQAYTVTTTEIYANALGLQATGQIGTLTPSAPDPVETEVSTVAAATTSSGGIAIQDASAITVGGVGSVPVNRVSISGSTLATTTAPLTQLSTKANGAIVLTAGGTITLAQAVVANGSGNILVKATGTASSVAANAGVASTTGSITVIGGLNVSLGFGDNIQTTGSVEIQATAGSATFNADSLVASGGGNIQVVAGVSVTVGGINAGSGSVALAAGATGLLITVDGVRSTTVVVPPLLL